MTGTLVNTAAVVAGGLLGVLAGRHIPENLRDILMQSLGLFVLVIGIRMALEPVSALAVLVCLLLGCVCGELLGIEGWLETAGRWLKERVNSGSGTFVDGFVAATVLFLSGAMTIVGCIQDGTAGDPSTLYIKAMLDGVASISLASVYGVGVIFSALAVLLVQGGLTMLAAALGFLREPEVLSMVTAAGGVLIIGIGINLLEIRRIRVGNMIPAVILAVLWPLVF